MSDGFTSEPVIGHHVGVERYRPETMFREVLGDPSERIRITVGDVDWDSTNEVTMTTETFEAIIEWYEETR